MVLACGNAAAAADLEGGWSVPSARPAKKSPAVWDHRESSVWFLLFESGILVRSYQRSLEILKFCGACLLVLLRYYSTTLVLVYRP